MSMLTPVVAHPRLARAAAAAVVLLGTAGAEALPVAEAEELPTVDRSQLPPLPPAGVNEDTQASVDGLAPGGVSATATSGCQTGFACVWVDPSFAGRRAQFAGANADWSVFRNASCPTGNWKDCASSLHNRHPETFYVFRDKNFGGQPGSVPSGRKFGTLGSFNDTIASNFF